ncbi:MAG: hypothetical protein V8R49_04460 [Duodenibacillus massiliensis]
MNYQSLAKLEKKLAGYPQKARDFLFAVVSDPWQVKRDNLRQLARSLGMTLLQGQDILVKLHADGFITEGSVEIASVVLRRLASENRARSDVCRPQGHAALGCDDVPL